LSICSVGFSLRTTPTQAKAYATASMERVLYFCFHMGLHFIEGIIGLDFFRAIRKKLVIDFVRNELEIIESEE